MQASNTSCQHKIVQHVHDATRLSSSVAGGPGVGSTTAMHHMLVVLTVVELVRWLLAANKVLQQVTAESRKAGLKSGGSWALQAPSCSSKRGRHMTPYHVGGCLELHGAARLHIKR
jgi:hypothetical protein